MKITVERGAFLKALSHVQSVVERRNTHPHPVERADRCGKGTAQADGHRSRYRNLAELLPADVLRNGAATAPAHMLYDIVRKLPDAPQVQLELLAAEGGRLAVSAGTVRFELACLPKEDFPADGGWCPAPSLPHAGG